METPVVGDIADHCDISVVPTPALPEFADLAETEGAPHAWPARRFSVDPSSSPQLMAAFAWDARG